jgi:membrane protein DedA with SNARE-associated domain
VKQRFFKGDRQRHLDRAGRMLKERGGYFIIIGRFIPGDRTAVTFGAGILHYPWPRFIVYDVIAGALGHVLLGPHRLLRGKAFEDEPWKGIVVALAIAFGIAMAVEGYRWMRRRSRAAPQQ